MSKKSNYVYHKGNTLLDDKEYCYHGCVTRQLCPKCKGPIYKDIKMNAFCLSCGTNTEF